MKQEKLLLLPFAAGLSAACSLRLSETEPSSPFLVGVRTCISSGWMPMRFGSRSAHSSTIVSDARSCSGRFSRKRPPVFLRNSGCSPLFISCAQRTMRLPRTWEE